MPTFVKPRRGRLMSDSSSWFWAGGDGIFGECGLLGMEPLGSEEAGTRGGLRGEKSGRDSVEVSAAAASGDMGRFAFWRALPDSQLPSLGIKK